MSSECFTVGRKKKQNKNEQKKNKPNKQTKT